MHNFDTDAEGKQLTGWTVTPVAQSAVIAALQYLEGPEQLETMESNSIQLVLAPQQALELAEALRKAAEPLLNRFQSGVR